MAAGGIHQALVHGKVEDLPTLGGFLRQHGHEPVQALNIRTEKGVVQEEEPRLPCQDVLGQGQAQGQVQLVVSALAEGGGGEGEALAVLHLNVELLIQADSRIAAAGNGAENFLHRLSRTHQVCHFLLFFPLQLFSDFQAFA